MAEAGATLTPSQPVFWNDPKIRNIVYQVVFLAVVLAVSWYFYSNTSQNMEKRGIISGFDFLNSTAGFKITQTLVPFTEESSYGRAYIASLINTLLVSFIGIVLATMLGFTIGVARLSSNWLIARLATVYVEIFRNIPLLLQIFFWWAAVIKSLPGVREALHIGDSVFLSNRGLIVPRPIPEDSFVWVFGLFVIGVVGTFVLRRWARRRQEKTGQQFPTGYAGLTLIIAVPVVVGAIFWLLGAKPLTFELPELGAFSFTGGITVVPEFAGLLIALVTYTSAYIAEVVRAGIVSVSHGQSEAAHALGLKPRWTLNLVIIPQAMRVIIPPLTNQYLNLTKNSSLGTAIGYAELVAVFGQTVLTQTGQAIEVIGITMATYLTISVATSMLMNWYNRRKQLVVR